MITFAIALSRVRLLRVKLLLTSALKVLTLGISKKFSFFPLTPFLNWSRLPEERPSASCDLALEKSVDVLISLYQFEKYQPVLEQSIESCFQNRKITFHFVVVSGSNREIEWIQRVVGNSHHKLHLVSDRIGIYESWNKAIESGTGEFITNLNADDLRLPHSICSQATDLQRLSVDGSYGNFYLSEDILSTLEFPSKRILRSSLEAFGKDTLVENSLNFMHCAPMWRRSLHEKLGLFDGSLKSSGDTEFWLRSLSAGAQFVQYKPATTVYFHNPEGLSTSLSSAGRREWLGIRDGFLKSNPSPKRPQG